MRLAIVGTGLIGASVGLAAKRAGVAHVDGFDPDPAALERAVERGAIDASAPSVAEAVAAADLAVVAAPVAELPAQVAAVLGASPERCTVTDVGSTKGPVCAAAAGTTRFIGGHPVCGSEAYGPENARAELFEGATWFLTPVAATDPQRSRALHGFVSSLGAVPVAVDPAAHDRLLALTSHLPHALANLLLNQAGGSRVEGHEPLAAAGGSLRDIARVAGANPRLWVDIFLDNAGARGGADQHRGLRAPPRVAGARGAAHAARGRRARGETRRRPARGAGVLRGRVPARPGMTKVAPAGALVGHIGVPGDKSISHRAVLVGALCEGESVVRGFGRSADTEATVAAVRALGVDVAEEDVDVLRVAGRGRHGLRSPDAPIDCANAGTLLRLLTGIVAAQDGRYELTGDESLRRRPVDRVAEPLGRMGARIETTDGRPPLVVEGAALTGIEYQPPVPSAQVKSALLLAGVLARSGTTTVAEPVPTRDHTEVMLAAAGARVRRGPASVSGEPAAPLPPAG